MLLSPSRGVIGISSAYFYCAIFFSCAAAAVASLFFSFPFSAHGADAASSASPKHENGIDVSWEPLIRRLCDDGFNRAEMETLFAGLGLKSYSPAFMAAKIMELHGIPGIGIRRDTVPAPEIPSGYVRPVPDITIGSCLAFIQEHAEVLADIEQRHGVKADTILAILLVETGMGLVMGDDIALRSLASMAATDSPARLAEQKNSSQAARIQPHVLASTIKSKSDWAYNELRSLIIYGQKNGLDISRLPGSFYGAIGLCQFMPSNIPLLAADGDGDGKIDLFSPVDAMYSVANYLETNGWRGATSENQRSAVIRTYNDDAFYAASVLGTARILANALKGGKVSLQSNAIASAGFVPSARLDPSLRRIRHVPQRARVKSLGSYKSLLE